MGCVRTKFLDLGDDILLRYVHAGASTLPGIPPPLARGTALFFVAGAGGSAPHFAPQLESFAAAHSPLALDLPGHGRSTGLAGPATIEAAAALVLAALERLAAPPVVLVGHGLGGLIALVAALADASRIRSVVTIGTGIRCDIPEIEFEKLAGVVSGRTGQFFDTPFFAEGTTPDVMRAFFGALVQTDPRVRLQDMRLHREARVAERLDRLGVPLRVLRGAQDRLLSAASADELAAAVGVAVDTVEGAGHVPQLENPEAVNSILAEVCA